MAMVIAHNMAALGALNTLNGNTKALGKSLKQASSGQRINSAGDDASGYAISERMRVQIRGLDQDKSNAQNAMSLLRVAEGAVARSVDIMRTMKEKAINAANDTNTDEDRAIIQKELDQIIDQVDDNSLVTFNGKYLFDGAADRSSNVEQTIVKALYSEWIPNSLDLIESSMGLGFNRGDPSVKEMGVYFADEGATGTLAYVTNWSNSATGVANRLALTVNMNYFADMKEDDVNGSSSGGYLDRTIAHEMTHAVMAANIEGFRGLYGCITEGAAEVVHGIDDVRNIKAAADDIDGYITKTAGTGDVKMYSGGYMMFRYMAAQSGGYSATESLTQFMASLAGGKGAMTADRINAAVSAATKGRFASFDDMKTAMKNDRGASASAEDFLLKYCNIDLENNIVDVGSISGSDAGGRFHKNAENTVYEAGSTKFWTNPTEKSSFINGLEVKWQEPAEEVEFSPTDKRNWHSATIQITGGMSFQIGTKANQTINVKMSNMDAEALGLRDKNRKNLQVTTQAKATAAIYQLDKSLERALNQQTMIGAAEARLEMTVANITVAHENTTNAESVIRDADMAKAMTDYTKNNVLAQAAQSMLAQANQNSSNVLSLLQ